uniref:Uncharacterized protein n=1 Tax=Mycobacterium sp. (strain JS330) TaxID=1004011 RepID=F4ZCI4_MYCS0|nr:hypothetical protein [Mycobacterium sp. JS330]
MVLTLACQADETESAASSAVMVAERT